MRYFIAVLVVIFFIVFGTILLLGRDNDSPIDVTPDNVKTVTFAESDTSKMVLTIQGRIVADENHYTLRISVSSGERVVELLKGYEQKLVERKTYKNNETAYRNFLKAIDNAGFGRQRSVEVTDEEGVCATGRRYIYQVVNDGSDVLRTWSTSCSAKHGPFAGAASTNRNLFLNQVPDHRKMITGINF